MYSFSRLQTICIINQMSRNFYTNSINNNIGKEAKYMNKLFRKNRLNGNNNINDSYSDPKKELSIHTKRRQNALNKIFMSHITDLMSMGELEPKLANKSIEISHVKITPDFKLVNVFWIDNSSNQSDTEEILKDCAYQLRYELCKLRVIGNVPIIQFVKCKHVEVTKEVERRLKIADFGEDHVHHFYPLSINHTITSKNSNETESANGDENLNDTFSVTLPIMRHNVFGLDHFNIMSKIKASLEKTRKAAEKRAESTYSNETTSPEPVTQNIPHFLNKEEETEEFSKFLEVRRRELRWKYRNLRASDNVVTQLNDDVERSDHEDDYEDETDSFSDGESEFEDSYTEKD